MLALLVISSIVGALVLAFAVDFLWERRLQKGIVTRVTAKRSRSA